MKTDEKEMHGAMTKTIKHNLIFIALCLPIISSVLSLSAYLGDFEHKVYIYETDSVSIAINEEYEDGQIIHNGSQLSYNCSVENKGVSDCYVFVEFDCATVSSQPLFIPQPATGWELYDEDEVTIEQQKYHRYVFSYSSGTTMTSLESGESTENVFNGPIDMLEMDDATYAGIANIQFHVVARAVMVGEKNSDVDTAWEQVPDGY